MPGRSETLSQHRRDLASNLFRSCNQRAIAMVYVGAGDAQRLRDDLALRIVQVRIMFGIVGATVTAAQLSEI
jgi:hypothetical protein